MEPKTSRGNFKPDFFQELEGKFGVKITGKLANFLRTVEIVRPNRFMTSEMKWCGVGRKKLDREKFFRAFLLKAEFNLPTTKVLIESLRTNTSWRLLCGWEYSSRIPSEATFSRAFAEFAKAELPSAVHQVRYHVRSGVERANSEMKDNYGANQVRIKGHLKVLCHLMFGVLVLTAKQIFNYFA